MILWISSEGRSGNTFFRIVMHQLYGLDSYAAFNASEVLLAADAGELVGAQQMPARLREAVGKGKPEEIRVALEELESKKEIHVFKTHARAHQLFGTNFRSILIVRDGRDALASYAHYLVDLRFDRNMLKRRLRRMRGASSELFAATAWAHVVKIFLVAVLKKLGLRKRLIRWRIDQLLNRNHPLFFDWSGMNRSWLEREPRPVVVYFDDLVREPLATVKNAVDQLGIGLVPEAEASIPSFGELRGKYPSFFRKGVSGDWKNHFSAEQHELFKVEHGAMMVRLNFPV